MLGMHVVLLFGFNNTMPAVLLTISSLALHVNALSMNCICDFKL